MPSTAASLAIGTAIGVAGVLTVQEVIRRRRNRPAKTKEPEFETPPEECPGVQSEKAGKSSACDGCPNQKLCSTGEAKKKDPALSAVAARLANVRRKVLVLSGKGGVGKSTVSAQLAFALSTENDVGLLDIDICGPSLPRMLGLHGHEVHHSADGWSPVYVDDRLAVMSIGFMLPNQDDAIIWRGPKKNGLIKQFLTDVTWGSLDMLLVDTPPGTSDEHLSIVTYLADANIDGAVIVTTPQEVSLQDVRKEINFCRKVGIKIIGVIENMSGFVCPSCHCETDILRPSTGGAREMCKQMKVPFLGSIPMDQALVMCGEHGKSLAEVTQDEAVLERLQSIVTNIMQTVDNKTAA